jgi:hypothetical protein
VFGPRYQAGLSGRCVCSDGGDGYRRLARILDTLKFEATITKSSSASWSMPTPETEPTHWIVARNRATHDESVWQNSIPVQVWDNNKAIHKQDEGVIAMNEDNEFNWGGGGGGGALAYRTQNGRGRLARTWSTDTEKMKHAVLVLMEVVSSVAKPSTCFGTASATAVLPKSCVGPGNMHLIRLAGRRLSA